MKHYLTVTNIVYILQNVDPLMVKGIQTASTRKNSSNICEFELTQRFIMIICTL
jgi:hypothetical protein